MSLVGVHGVQKCNATMLFKAHQCHFSENLDWHSSWHFCESLSFFFLLLPAGFRAATVTAAAAGIPAACLCVVSARRPGAAGRGQHAALLWSAAHQPAHHHEVIKTHRQSGKNLNCLFFFLWGRLKLISIFLTLGCFYWSFLSG